DDAIPKAIGGDRKISPAQAKLENGLRHLDPSLDASALSGARQCPRHCSSDKALTQDDGPVGTHLTHMHGALVQAETRTSDHLWPIATLSPWSTSGHQVLCARGRRAGVGLLFRQSALLQGSSTLGPNTVGSYWAAAIIGWCARRKVRTRLMVRASSSGG